MASPPPIANYVCTYSRVLVQSYFVRVMLGVFHTKRWYKISREVFLHFSS